VGAEKMHATANTSKPCAGHFIFLKIALTVT
jgi:hypothetical protein